MEASTLLLALILAFLWVLWFECWQKYRVDVFRQDLFELRDELFLYAADKTIAFDHPAYKRLRVHINGMIRFAHNVTLAMVLISIVKEKMAPDPQFQKNITEWNDDLKSVESAEAREKLLDIQKRMIGLVGKQMCLMSPLIVVLSGIFAVYYFVWRRFKRGTSAILENWARNIDGLAFDTMPPSLRNDYRGKTAIA